MADTYEAVLTCPWCDYHRTVVSESNEQVLRLGRAAIATHNLTVHPDLTLKPGAVPRKGFYQGKPMN